MKEKLVKLLNGLRATARDLVLAGIAAATGFLVGRELPKTGVEVKALIVGAVYAGARAIVALVAAKLAAKAAA